MNVFVATGALSSEFDLSLTGFDTIPGPTQNQTISSEPKKSPAAKANVRSWTQPDLNDAIRKYQAQRASGYRDLLEGVRAGRPGAKKAAQKMFGRNAIARELQVKAPAMVTNSPVWQAIADELRIPRGKDRNQKASQKVGLNIAIEQQALETAKSGIELVVQDETLRLIRKSMSDAEAEPLVEQLQRGDITDDQAREIVSMTRDQKRDQRSRKVSGNP